MPSLLFCGPKMAACGIVISIWGVIMLVGTAGASAGPDYFLDSCSAAELDELFRASLFMDDGRRLKVSNSQFVSALGGRAAPPVCMN